MNAHLEQKRVLVGPYWIVKGKISGECKGLRKKIMLRIDEN